MNLLGSVAETLGTTEAALRLLLSLLMGYPLAALHWSVVGAKSPAVQSLFFSVCGLLVGFFNFGWEIAHCLVCIAAQYAAMVAFGRHVACPLFSLVFQMTYLLLGYWYTESEDYDIRWTLPHCVLTLRLIGVAFDYYDGQKEPSQLTKEQKLTALRRCPTLLEMCGHSLFPTAMMVGPQFPMKRYKFLVRGDLRALRDVNGNELTPPVRLVLSRLGLGLAYTVLYIVGSGYFPVNYGVSDDLLNRPLWQRLLLVAVWAKVNIMKYLSCWLIAEGACILSGLSFNGFDEAGEAKWDGSRNIHVLTYETATEYQHMITCFNTNTNAWVSCYIFKRLKFLNKKEISHLAALGFLAVWHGLHLGYYVTFFNEYLIVTRERDFYKILDRSPVYQSWFSNPLVRAVARPLKMIWLWIGLSYAAVPFLLLTTAKWLRLYVSLYFHIHVVFLAYPYAKASLKRWLGVVPSPEQTKKDLGDTGREGEAEDEGKGVGTEGVGCDANGGVARDSNGAVTTADLTEMAVKKMN